MFTPALLQEPFDAMYSRESWDRMSDIAKMDLLDRLANLYKILDAENAIEYDGRKLSAHLRPFLMAMRFGRGWNPGHAVWRFSSCIMNVWPASNKARYLLDVVHLFNGAGIMLQADHARTGEAYVPNNFLMTAEGTALAVVRSIYFVWE